MNGVFLDQATFVEGLDIGAIKAPCKNFIAYPLTSANQVVERCRDADVIITNKVILDEAILTQLPKLKLICIAATGTNNIDIAAAKKQGIAVTNVSGYSTPSVAQYVFAQLLDYFSKPHHHQQNVEQGLWQQSPSFCYHGAGSVELSEKTLAIIGYGNLGRAVATVGRAFGMKVLITERPNTSKIRAERVSFEQALGEADIVSLHCPLTAETEKLINANALAKMKPSAVLINSARGGIVDEQALLVALKDKTIAYAVLDVLAQEPPDAHHPLLVNQPSNLKITAHIAWASVESQQRLLDLIGDNIASFIANKSLNRVD